MARMTVDGAELENGVIDKLGAQARPMIKRIVMAGAGAAEQRMRENIQRRQHVRTGDMLEAVGHTEYRESFRGGQTEVYPLDEDRHGVRNATKAYVINYGRGGVKRNGGRMGDKFITGDEKNTEQAVTQAMQAESDRIVDKIMKE